MRHQANPRFLGDVLEMTVAVIFEQHISAAHRSDEQILAAVVVNVGECRAHADTFGQPDSRYRCDVLELAATKVLPQFVAPDLIYKVDVIKSIPIDVRDRNRAAMVVVTHPHVLGHVVDGMVHEPDAALLAFVGELELVKDLKLIHRLQLRLLAGWETIGSNVLIGIARTWGGGVRSFRPEDERSDR